MIGRAFVHGVWYRVSTSVRGKFKIDKKNENDSWEYFDTVKSESKTPQEVMQDYFKHKEKTNEA